MLVLSVPHLDSYIQALSGLGGELEYSDVHWHVGQVSGESAPWSGHGDLSSFDGNLH